LEITLEKKNKILSNTITAATVNTSSKKRKFFIVKKVRAVIKNLNPKKMLNQSDFTKAGRNRNLSLNFVMQFLGASFYPNKESSKLLRYRSLEKLQKLLNRVDQLAYCLFFQNYFRNFYSQGSVIIEKYKLIPNYQFSF
jgi:hypothetical protein